MSATDELRRMLEERGVGWADDDGRFAKVTKWTDLNGRLAIFAEYNSGETGFAMDNLSLTPEQAIAATLGSEREKELEELVQDWQALYEEPDYGDCCRLRKRMQELGIEVIDE